MIGSFSDVIKIAKTLPTEIVDAAHSVVTDAFNLFNEIGDGSIVSDLAKVPGIVVSYVTAECCGLTSGLVGAWNEATEDIACVFGDCPTPDASARDFCATAITTACTLIHISLS